MIRSISTQNNQWLNVNFSNNSPHINSTNISAGILRYNPHSSAVEVYDGNTWYSISGHADVNLTQESKRIMEWANKKMREEEQLKSLMEKHPGLKELHDKFELMKALVAQESKNL